MTETAVAGDDLVIVARDVTKRFGDTLALDAVSLDVRVPDGRRVAAAAGPGAADRDQTLTL